MYKKYDYTNMYYPNASNQLKQFQLPYPELIMPEDIFGRTNEDRRARLEYEYFVSIYPNEVRRIHSFVKQKVDENEYPSSFIYDEYPDKERIYSMVEEIAETVKWNIECKEPTEAGENDMEEMPADMLSCDYVRGGQGLYNVIHILLVNEIMRRRVRRGNGREYSRGDYSYLFK